MIKDRKQAFDVVCRGFAITRYEIEAHQSIGDYSLNIHGENFFRDLLNDILNLNLTNTNFNTPNAKCIDLIDNIVKLGIQITTTRTKEKIKNTLKILTQPSFFDYKIHIYYLLDKANPTDATIIEFEKEYSIKLSDILFDHTDIIKHINNLPEDKLISIAKKYFTKINETYTEEIALDLIIKHLILTKNQTKITYDDSFGSIDINEKLKLNNINSRVSACINSGFDYRYLLEKLNIEDHLLTNLRSLVVDDIYASILSKEVSAIEKIQSQYRFDVNYLHGRAILLNLDFNKILFTVHESLCARVDIKDFNTSDIGWIVISYFFEICDIGAHTK
jgi:hypothetical protein